jgi:hypothetical protein
MTIVVMIFEGLFTSDDAGHIQPEVRSISHPVQKSDVSGSSDHVHSNNKEVIEESNPAADAW